MGNHNSKSIIQLYAPKFEIHARDESHGLVYLTEKETRRQHLFKQIVLADTRMMQALGKQLQKEKTLLHDNLVRLKDYLVYNGQTVVLSSICGALYEFPFDSLENFRQVRIRAAKLLTQKELWEILTGSSAGLGYLQSRNIQHGSVRSGNIYVEHTGRIKVAFPTVKELESNYEQFEERSPGVYISPNELRSLKQGMKVPVHNSYKSDVFSLGLVVLEMACLQTQDDLYNTSKFTLKEGLLMGRLQKVTKQYGKSLGKVLSAMLQLIESQRIDWVELLHLLQKNHERHTQQREMALSLKDRRKEIKSPSNKKGGVDRKLLNIGHLLPKTEGYKPFVGKLRATGEPISQFGQYQGCNKTIISITSSPQDPMSVRFDDQGIFQQAKPADHQTPGPLLPKIEFPWLSEKKPTHHRNRSGHKKQLSDANINQTKISLSNRRFSPSPPKYSQPKQFTQQLISKLNEPIIEEIRQSPKKHVQIKVVPMGPSYPDRPSDNTYFPTPDYKLKTIADENIVEVTARPSLSQMLSSNEDILNEQYLQMLVKKNQMESQTVFKMKKQLCREPTVAELDLRKKKFQSAKKDNSQNLDRAHNSNLGIIAGSPGMQYVKEVFKQGARYEGWKFNGMRHGNGKFYYLDGGRYQGEWDMNKMHGNGTLYYPSGEKAYHGSWVNDHFHGRGKLYNQQTKYIEKFNYSNFDGVEDYWRTYEGIYEIIAGDFENDLKHGFGVLILCNGEIYEGYFNNDYVHGEGIYRSRSGIIKGRWQRNKLVRIL